MGRFVSQRIQKFSKGGDHIEMPGDLAVHHIRQAGNGQNDAGDPVIPGFRGVEIDVHIHRNQGKPNQAEYIGNIENIFFYFHASFLSNPNLNILKNITFSVDNDLGVILIDHYKMFEINVKAEK